MINAYFIFDDLLRKFLSIHSLRCVHYAECVQCVRIIDLGIKFGATLPSLDTPPLYLRIWNIFGLIIPKSFKHKAKTTVV
ncbi:hypothetical protein VNO77_05352 [Canavalia gladiata]|uniref:Uncharacterized protein n=1 Tax=Canavalia gladiata TaxID=3824 RepID=A0AAN9N3W4_CANGL